jgi:hypothetical protein
MMATVPMDPVPPAVVAKERIALAFGAALLAAGLILVVAVLPAEYGVDPLGIGRKLGLTAMSDVQKGLEAFQATQTTAAGGAPTVAPRERRYQNDTVEFKLPPGGFIEYKYRLDKGSALLYSWTATGPVNYELHAEPDGAPQGYAESFEKKNAMDTGSGTLTAPFSGIHGWYWENPGRTEVTVTLSAAGFYNMSHEFRKDQPPTTKMFQ